MICFGFIFVKIVHSVLKHMPLPSANFFEILLLCQFYSLFIGVGWCSLHFVGPSYKLICTIFWTPFLEAKDSRSSFLTDQNFHFSSILSTVSQPVRISHRSACARIQVEKERRQFFIGLRDA